MAKAPSFRCRGTARPGSRSGWTLDSFFPPNGPARYEYRLRCELEAGANLKNLKIVNDLQMAPLALPAVADGMNNFVYSDQSPGEKVVRITHDWAERENTTKPGTSAFPLFPPNGGFSEGTNIIFRWKSPPTPGANSPIIDYQFELSDRPDMLWPLSPNFYKLVSKTADQPKPQYTLPESGLLNPGQTYYWRVKAKNEMGAWGSWSDVWSFAPRAIATPSNLALAVDSEHGLGTFLLAAQPNGGRNPCILPHLWE